ncbi:nucleoside deaminase [Candidatus Babeliales bacterium]|nr:nucleoside deaminase [Candidatus Babeliales bacterium]
MDNFFLQQAYAQACKAFDQDEVPVGAILVDGNGKILARAYNQIEQKGTQLAHAEMQVLAKAAKKMNNWRLQNTTLYVTVQPCMMCIGALFLSRVERVVFAVKSLKFGVNTIQSEGIYKNLKLKIEYSPDEQSAELLKLFFKKKRSKVTCFVNQNYIKSNKIYCKEKKKLNKNCKN